MVELCFIEYRNPREETEIIQVSPVENLVSINMLTIFNSIVIGVSESEFEGCNNQ